MLKIKNASTVDFSSTKFTPAASTTAAVVILQNIPSFCLSLSLPIPIPIPSFCGTKFPAK